MTTETEDSERGLPRSAPPTCPRCSEPMSSGIVKTAIFEEDRIFIVEDIPAIVCEHCLEQYYDDETVEAMRRLSEAGFPSDEVNRTLLVPVYSLARRLPRAH